MGLVVAFQNGGGPKGPALDRQSNAHGGRDITGEPMNDELKQHVLEADDWQYREHAQVLHKWAERFNQEFKLGLPTAAIQMERICVRRLGTYRRGRNGFGLRHEITLNTTYAERPLANQVEVLLHEQLHQWQALYGTPSRGHNNYHNRQFRQKARLYGLIVDPRGHHLGVEMGRFTMLLAQYGVDMATLRIPEEKPVRRAGMLRGDSKLKKWSCGCTNVRCAVALAAQCLRCGNPFQESAPSW
jgi:SprT-like family protein